MTFYIKVLLKQYTMLFYKYITCIYKISYFLEFLALSKNATKLLQCIRFQLGNDVSA